MTATRTATSASVSWIEEASARFVAAMPGHIERLGWDAPRLRAHQDDALAELVRTAATWSPFHRRRLGAVNPSTIRVEHLGELPVMTKADMMAELDDVFTDRRLTRALVERHLAATGDRPALLLGQYVALASGGSSGTRGVFVYHVDDVAHFTAAVLRTGMAQLAAAGGWPPPARIPFALVMAPGAMHATRTMTCVLSAIAHVTRAPVTLPFEEIVDRVNRAAPAVLAGYASVIARLGDAAVAGSLTIAPEVVITTAEQLQPGHVARITAGFGVAPVDSFASTEGLTGTAPPGSDEFTFASDRAIVEFVDEDDRPVPPGRPAHHVLVTNLANLAQPLIRYRMDDAMTELPPSSGHVHQRATVDGRADELLTVDGVRIHPLVLRSALLRHETIAEYQVRIAAPIGATAARVEFDLVTTGPTDLSRVASDVEAALRDAGASAAVTARQVDDVGRDGATGKVRRFLDG